VFEVQQTTAGDWAVVIAEGRVLLVETAHGSGRLRSYRRALRGGFAAALEALAAEGFARTPAFALAEVRDEQVLVAVRGAATATVMGAETERVIDAAGVSTWSEQQVSGATAGLLSVGGGAAPAGDALPVSDGIVWGEAVSWPAAGDDEDDESGSVAAGVEPANAPVTAPIALDEPALDVPAVAEPAVERPEPDPDPAVPEPAVAEATISEPSEATGYDHLFGATMMRSVEDAAVRPEGENDDVESSQRIDIPGFVTDSTPPPASDREGDHDGMTVLSGSLSALLERDRPASEAPASAASMPPRFFVDLFDGRREYLEPPIVVGRAPIASTTARGPAPRPITVTSAEQDISRSHASIAVEGDSVVVTDLHSRNGTIVVMPGKSPQKLRQGEPTTVIVGTLVDLGSGVTLTVGQDV
jgi:hypothetical protein